MTELIILAFLLIAYRAPHNTVIGWMIIITSKIIAIGGILFEHEEAFSIGAKLQVSIPLAKDSDSLLLIGTVVRVEEFGPDNYDIGMILSFKEMEQAAKDEISKFLIEQGNPD